ncbi:MAG: hypothetical protein HY611_04820, partial [Elusimicrobia bacterium]|nr:hypothetical protein [Elusimicrobiota bacterium]
LKVTVTDWLGRPTEIKGTFNSGMLAAVLDARASKEPGKILDLYAQARSRGQDYEAIDIPVLPKPQTEAKPGGPGAKPAPSPAQAPEKTVPPEAQSQTALQVP